MRDIFFETSSSCEICGTGDCVHFPEMVVPHAADRYKVPHVLAPEDVLSPPTEYGARRLIYRKGDPVPLSVAADLGWTDEQVRGPSRPATRRRVPSPRTPVA